GGGGVGGVGMGGVGVGGGVGGGGGAGEGAKASGTSSLSTVTVAVARYSGGSAVTTARDTASIAASTPAARRPRRLQMSAMRSSPDRVESPMAVPSGDEDHVAGAQAALGLAGPPPD